MQSIAFVIAFYLFRNSKHTCLYIRLALMWDYVKMCCNNPKGSWGPALSGVTTESLSSETKTAVLVAAVA